MEQNIDYKQLQNFWKERQKTSKHMDRDKVYEHIKTFIKNHNTCGFATGYGDYVRCTPIEYNFMDEEFWFISEGGNKFIGLEKNKNVSLAIFDYYGDMNNSHGLQVMGKAILYDNKSDEFKKVLAFKNIEFDVVRAAKVNLAVVRVIPTEYEMFDTDFRKEGYDVRQFVRFDDRK